MKIDDRETTYATATVEDGSGSCLGRRIATLTRMLAARDRTIEVLIQRIESRSAREGSAYAVLEQNIALEQVVSRKTRELECEREQLKTAVDELRSTQVRLLQAQKMESIGQLAAGVAHEINTPTQYVSDNIAFLRNAFDRTFEALDTAFATLDALREVRIGPDGIGAALGRIDRRKLDFVRENAAAAFSESQDGLNRVATIVAAMKQFSHPSAGEKELVDLAEIVRTTVTVARNEWKYVAALDMQFDPQLPEVRCLRDEVSQVILNLVVNAAHAIADVVAGDREARGRIVISTHLDGDVAELRVSDTGTGIPEKIRARVFDPFFTTKGVGQGTGQGLAMAYSTIVDKHGGQIYLESEVGTGTTFFVRLPIVPPCAEHVSCG
ncbi:sensor histidine kinase [Tahibacter soli]|uniref:histidine kinase n=1 Tax=Tahibacter soli TaxID=2983605 RepID=A0A9X3YKB9_9GAMM|nr:ATP-binding protein [Tahibacter soli]MDC8012830.1 ATP-binding protein [Tahibacter soli]